MSKSMEVLYNLKCLPNPPPSCPPPPNKIDVPYLGVKYKLMYFLLQIIDLSWRESAGNKKKKSFHELV